MTDEPNDDTPPPLDGDDNKTPDPVTAPESVLEPSEAPASESPASPSSGGTIALGQGKLEEKEEKTMSLLAHILGGVTCFLGPLIIWLIKKDDSPFVNDQGKTALNFQLTMLIGYVGINILNGLMSGKHRQLRYWCWSIMALWVASLIFAIIGGLEANKGKAYRYPFSLDLVK